MKFDPWSHLVFITAGFPDDAFHKHLGNGTAIRFDEDTREFRGVAMVMLDHEPVELPVRARLTLLMDEAVLEPNRAF